MAQQEEQQEHCVKGDNSNLQPAFTAHYKKE
jgi:hypothetical protein